MMERSWIPKRLAEDPSSLIAYPLPALLTTRHRRPPKRLTVPQKHTPDGVPLCLSGLPRRCPPLISPPR